MIMKTNYEINPFFIMVLINLIITLIGCSIRLYGESNISISQNRELTRKNERVQTIGIIIFYIGNFLFALSNTFWLIIRFDSFLGYIFIPLYLFLLRNDIKRVFLIEKNYIDLFCIIYSMTFLPAFS